MAKTGGRLIKPPIESVLSGRVFRPSRILMFKKWLKLSIVVSFGWLALWAALFSHPVIQDIMITISEPLELVIGIGWITLSVYYWMAAIALLTLAALYIYVYVNRIEYSVVGWEGEAMPEIYCVKGIINITKKHVPFRTIVFVRTRRGPFDRLLGIGNVMVETAGGSTPQQSSGLITLLIGSMTSSATEERIEGIRFHEELRDFILQELRGFGRTPLVVETRKRLGGKSRILNQDTLMAFREIRDALRERHASATA